MVVPGSPSPDSFLLLDQDEEEGECRTNAMEGFMHFCTHFAFPVGMNSIPVRTYRDAIGSGSCCYDCITTEYVQTVK